VSGVRIPPSIIKEVKQESLEYHVQISFFYEPSAQFFGRTWRSPSSAIVDVKDEIVIAQQTVYFKTAILFDKCYAIVELVLEIKTDGVTSARYGVGWTILHLFGRTNLTDVLSVNISGSHDPMSRDVVAASLYAGTPRLLLLVDTSTDWKSTLHPAGNVKMLYTLHVYSLLKEVAHLFRSNELLGDKDVIGGLGTASGTLPSNPQTLIPPLPMVSISIINPSITLPPGFETCFMEHLTVIRSQRWSTVPNGKSTLTYHVSD